MTNGINDNGSASNVQTELLRLSTVCKCVGLSKSTIYQMIKTDKFPSSVKIGARAVAWHSSDVFKWIQDCPSTNLK